MIDEVRQILVGQTVKSAMRGFATMATIDFAIKSVDSSGARVVPIPSVWAQCRRWCVEGSSDVEKKRVEVADGDGPIDFLEGLKVTSVSFVGGRLAICFDRAAAEFEVVADDEVVDVFLPDVVVSFGSKDVRSTPRGHREPG